MRSRLQAVVALEQDASLHPHPHPTFTPRSCHYLVLVDHRCFARTHTPVCALARRGPCDRGGLSEHVARLRNCGTLTELRTHPENALLKKDRLRFQPLLQAHIRPFDACPSLTQFELGFPCDIEFRVLTDLISALPFLTHLRICGGSYTIIQCETGSATGAFTPHLHQMDIWLNGGTSIFFEWLLSHSKPPIFTSLTLAGSAGGESMAPIEAYLRRHGPSIETLSLCYWMNDFRETETFERRALAFTPRLVSLSLTGQYPATILITLTLSSSIHLVNLEISVCPIPLLAARIGPESMTSWWPASGLCSASPYARVAKNIPNTRNKGTPATSECTGDFSP
ncbi:hypothetical protein FB451DRAFT_1508576 [Mycena latifolia]|nr:hypothetical protein FB451DRAFT_1508576 [Mycena latifolia]